MTTSEYYILFTLSLVAITLVSVPPIVKLFQLIAEGLREAEAAKQSQSDNLPAVLDGAPDPQERT